MFASNVKVMEDSKSYSDSEDEDKIKEKNKIEEMKTHLIDNDEIFEGNANYLLFIGKIDQGII